MRWGGSPVPANEGLARRRSRQEPEVGVHGEPGSPPPWGSPGEVHTHGQVAVAAVRVEALGAQGELHQGDVGGIHALQVDAARAYVPAGLIDEILQRLQHLLQDGALDQARLEHGGRVTTTQLQAEIKRKLFPAWASLGKSEPAKAGAHVGEPGRSQPARGACDGLIAPRLRARALRLCAACGYVTTLPRPLPVGETPGPIVALICM